MSPEETRSDALLALLSRSVNSRGQRGRHQRRRFSVYTVAIRVVAIVGSSRLIDDTANQSVS